MVACITDIVRKVITWSSRIWKNGGTYFDLSKLFDMKSTVWWAGKELDKTKPISDYTGKN